MHSFGEQTLPERRVRQHAVDNLLVAFLSAALSTAVAVALTVLARVLG